MRPFRVLVASVLALAAAAPAALGQITVFADDFEQGLGNWTTTGLWRQLKETDTCGALVSPFPSSDTCAYFGNGSCDFNGYQVGWLTMVEPVSLPAWAESAVLRFESFESVECTVCGWDWRFVYVSVDGGASWTWIGQGNQLNQWHTRTMNLDPYIGEDVLLRFEFDSVDSFANDGLGWLLDDVRIEVTAPDAPGTYCTAKVNSQGCEPYLAWSGDPSLSGSGHFVVRAFDVLDHAPGHFIWSLGFAALPFQGGTICVQTPAFRTTVKSSGGSAGTPCSGGYIHLFSHAFLDAHGVPPGATVFVQCRSRDWGLPPGQHASLSNALYFTRLP